MVIQALLIYEKRIQFCHDHNVPDHKCIPDFPVYLAIGQGHRKSIYNLFTNND